MKSLICTMVMMATMVTTQCQTPAEKTNAARTKFENAKLNLKQAREELNATFPAYKQEAKEQISINDKKIDALRANFIMPRRSPRNDESKREIDALQNTNIGLRDRLDLVKE